MSETKNQLHQLLAVEPSLEKTANMILSEAQDLFKKKGDHLDGMIKTYQPLAEDGESLPEERKEIVTNVRDKIAYVKDSQIKALDASISLEETNAGGAAKADLVVEGQKIATLSAIALLNLEKKLVKLRALYDAIPTLDPAKRWAKDETVDGHIYYTEPEKRYRQAKALKVLVKSPATDKFPAQTETYSVDETIGTFHTTYRSGKIYPIDKSTLLGRIDRLILATQEARARANQAPVVNTYVGEAIFVYINRGILE